MPEETLSELAETYDVVRTVDHPSGRAVVVGEHHSSAASRQLVARVLAAVSPELVAIESCPVQQSFFAESPQNVSEGAEAAVSYVQTQKKQLGLIDKRQHDLLTDIATLPVESVSTDPPEPAADGDIPADALHEYRATVRETAPQRYDQLWDARERYMAGVLHTLIETTPGPVCAVVGAGHLPAIVDHLAAGTAHPRDVDPARIRTPADGGRETDSSAR